MEKLTVIKAGGKIVEEEAASNQLLDDFAAKTASLPRIGSKMSDGGRITYAEALKVVEMMYRPHQKNIHGNCNFSPAHPSFI